jgi:hypothetical protein
MLKLMGKRQTEKIGKDRSKHFVIVEGGGHVIKCDDI